MLQPQFRQFAFLFSLLILAGCKKSAETAGSSGTDILSYSIKGVDAAVSSSALSKRILLRFPDNVSSGQGQVALFSLSPGASVSINNTEQLSGITANDFEKDLTYAVKAGNNSVVNWVVSASNNDVTMQWGLGHFLNNKQTQTRAYNWYIDQATTGQYCDVNCGPSAVTMAIKWADASFNGTAIDARMAYRPSGGWWFNSDITSYLSDHAINNTTITLGANSDASFEKVKKQLDQNRLVILTVDMNWVSAAAPGNEYVRVGKFYQTTPGWGHFLLLKGYRIVDGEKFYEVNDPNSWGKFNADDSGLKGNGRFYRATDVYDASANWWNYAIVIAEKGAIIDPSTLRAAVPKSSIPEAGGF